HHHSRPPADFYVTAPRRAYLCPYGVHRHVSPGRLIALLAHARALAVLLSAPGGLARARQPPGARLQTPVSSHPSGGAQTPQDCPGGGTGGPGSEPITCPTPRE